MDRFVETERLLLRPLTVDDAADVFEWVGDPVVNRYMPYSLYQDIGQVEKWLLSVKEENNEFAFCLKETQKVIGSGSIVFEPETNAYRLGYNINRSFWQKGYATEAAKAMIQWAYDYLNARDFIAKHASDNIASGNVLRKCGFVFDHYGKYSKFDGSETFQATYCKMHLT